MSPTNLRVRLITLSSALWIGASLVVATESETVAPDAKPQAADRASIESDRAQPEATPPGQRSPARARRVCPAASSGTKVNTLEELLAGDGARFLAAFEPVPPGSPKPPETPPRKDAQPAASVE